jgi:hypothetical protein
VPLLLPGLLGVWRVFHESRFSDMRSTFDGTLIGRDMNQVASVALGLGVPWDEVTIARFNAIFSAYSEYERRQRRK